MSLWLCPFSAVYGSSFELGISDSQEDSSASRTDLTLQLEYSDLKGLMDLLDNLRLVAGLRYDTVEQTLTNGPTLFATTSEVKPTPGPGNMEIWRSEIIKNRSPRRSLPVSFFLINALLYTI